MKKNDFIYLCTPVVTEEEKKYLHDALKSDWITTVGPHITAFENEFSTLLHPKAKSAALSSGTAAIHLACRLLNLKPNDEILCSSFTFIASASHAVYMGAIPSFVDSDHESWNMDPDLLAEELRKRAKKGRLPKAVILAHIYGHSANLGPIATACQEYEVPLIEDAAEALGTMYKGKHVGMHGTFSTFSFNGNKMITTGGGGLLASKDALAIQRAKYLSFQAKKNSHDYIHEELGYNYAMSNVLAAIGRGQLESLPSKIEKKQKIYQNYKQGFAKTPGLSMMPILPDTEASHWLSVLRIDPQIIKKSREYFLNNLTERNIQARATWKPLHTQPVFKGSAFVGSGICESIFEESICLPSGLNLTDEQQNRVIEEVLSLVKEKSPSKKTTDSKLYQTPSD